MHDRAVHLLNLLLAVSLPFTHIGGYAAGALSVVLAWPYRETIRRHPLILWLSAFILYGVARSALSGDPPTGYRTMAGYAAHWLLPFTLGTLLRSPHLVRLAFRVYLVTLMALLLVAVLAYYGLFHPKLGANWYLVDAGLLKAFHSHIALAGLCLMGSFLLLSSALNEASITRVQRGARIVVAMLFLGCLVLTGSRGYYMAAIVTYALFALSWVLRTGRWKVLAGIGVGIALLIALAYVGAPAVRERLHRAGPQDRNVQERIALYRVALWEVQARPMFGFGPGQGIRQEEFFHRLPADLRDVARHPHLHSIYLNCAADFGLVGFALFLCVLGFWLRAIWHASLAGEPLVRPLAGGMFWALVGVLVGDCFDALLRGPGTGIPMFWLSGLVLGCPRRDLPSATDGGEDVIRSVR